MGRSPRGHDRRRRVPARVRRRLGAGPRAGGRLPEHARADRGAGPGTDSPRARPLPGVCGQPPVHGEPASHHRPERRWHPRRPRGRHGPRALPARPRPSGPRPAPAAHPDRGRGRPRQDPGGRHPGERADRPWACTAHPGACGQEHAHPVPEGVLEPVHHPAHPARLHRHPAGAESHPDQPQSVLLLRQGDHLDRHAEAGCGVPHLPGAGVLGRDRHRRGAQRRGPGGRARSEVASPASWRDAPTPSSCSRRRRTTAARAASRAS